MPFLLYGVKPPSEPDMVQGPKKRKIVDNSSSNLVVPPVAKRTKGDVSEFLRSMGLKLKKTCDASSQFGKAGGNDMEVVEMRTPIENQDKIATVNGTHLQQGRSPVEGATAVLQGGTEHDPRVAPVTVAAPCCSSNAKNSGSQVAPSDQGCVQAPAHVGPERREDQPEVPVKRNPQDEDDLGVDVQGPALARPTLHSAKQPAQT